MNNVLCASCGKSVYKAPKEIRKSKSGNMFCSRSCSATYNNKSIKKRTLSCRQCGKLILSGYTYCNDCYISKHYLTDKTLLEAIGNRKDSNRYTGIRANARRIYYCSAKPKCCMVCGYDKHFEICHIKDIADFAPETKISEINNIENLVALCPNHHWEFDEGLLKSARWDSNPLVTRYERGA